MEDKEKAKPATFTYHLIIWFKILFITLLAQVLAILMTVTLSISPLPLLLLSNVLGVWLALEWCKTTKAKVLTVILMPTNYTILVILGFTLWLIWAFVGLCAHLD